MITIIVNQRRKGVKITDKRVRLTTEVLQGIRLIKMYGWEAFYIQQITKYREKEIKTVRKSSYDLSSISHLYNNFFIFPSFAVAWLVALFSIVPVLASILSFVSLHYTFHRLFNAFLDYIQSKWAQPQYSCHFCFAPTFQCRNHVFRPFNVRLS